MIFNNRYKKEILVLKETIKELQNHLTEKIDKQLMYIEELEQDKVYYIKVDSEEEVRILKDHLKMLERRLKWSMPKVIITTNDFTINPQ